MWKLRPWRGGASPGKGWGQVGAEAIFQKADALGSGTLTCVGPCSHKDHRQPWSVPGREGSQVAIRKDFSVNISGKEPHKMLRRRESETCESPAICDDVFSHSS